MYSIRIIGLISVLAGGVLNQAQQLNTGTATPADVKPAVTDLPVSGNSVTDLHLRPLFTTTIRLPEVVTSVAVGAPTLFEVEHSDQEPRLVFVKPSTKESATSNLVIAKIWLVARSSVRLVCCWTKQWSKRGLIAALHM